ncbi:DNA-binding transcriptional regulator, MarR family [Nocardioides exalbidus]|uniref:DNA-binding transcriptional regulator, MarR family n=1 Tax=Nocardioides exalbidus TaxID=402596 RepID=A0A1H4MZ34_9ACTN|nr:MarR family transcriptional regulator [Nocardioides exalbidus]SEB87908.1 DNA-binding transcriptional regulator, MarR family [Nocardioides exalbidus]
MTDHDVLDELVCFDLYAASRAMTQRYRPLLEEWGLTYPQYLVVVLLGGTGQSSIKDLAATMRLDHATLTPLLRRMEDAGLVTRRRDPDDGRSSLVGLTDLGREAHAGADAVQCRIVEDLGLAPDDVRALQLLLRGITASMDHAARADA